VSTDLSRLAAALADRYQIERELGVGGMATVYLAHDVRHDRKVALKVLKPELAAVLGAERFLQEIKTTARLQHPHILPLFDSGTADGFLFYVMPFIQGETLRQMLDRDTQLGVDESVKITADVADALDYAHRQGVVHRDIKPENILLANGRPVVADFGIALAVSAAAGGRMTETGLSLGTPHYMSPEQATAEKVIGPRSDIYSLGSVLYEMLTGNPPHTGASSQQIIMKIVTEEPQPVTRVRKSVPPNVSAAVSKSLEKLPADRFASARAFADALANPGFATAASSGVATSGTSGSRWLQNPRSWGVLVVAGAAVLALIVFRRADDPSQHLVLRTELTFGIPTSDVDISPDGSTIVFAGGDSASGRRLYLRRLDDLKPRAIPGTEGTWLTPYWPRFSPDGKAIAFLDQSARIRRIPITGGAPTLVTADSSLGFILTLRWADDGYLYFSGTDGLARVADAGGTAEVLFRSQSLVVVNSVTPIPGGAKVVFVQAAASWDSVYILDLSTRKTQSLGIAATEAIYIPTGHLLLSSGEALSAVAFNAATGRVVGTPVPIMDSISANGTVRNFALSRGGTAVYLVAPAASRTVRIVLVDRAGVQQPLPLPEGHYHDVRFSPDGRRLAFVAAWESGERSVNTYDLVVGTTTKLWSGPSGINAIAWSRNSDRILVAMKKPADSVTVIVAIRADGSRRTDTLISRVSSTDALDGVSQAPDGKRLLFSTSRNDTPDLRATLSILALDGSGTVSPYLHADWLQGQGEISPDGRWAAYQSNEEVPPAGRNSFLGVRTYARSFPEPGVRHDVSAGPGFNPRWSPDGRALFYMRYTDHGDALVEVGVRTEPTFAVTAPAERFSLAGLDINFYDVQPGGKHFAFVTRHAAPGDTQGRSMILVVNWLEDFKRIMQARH
jgi:eukaryotic-like serine/threonine-protein kinase